MSLLYGSNYGPEYEADADAVNLRAGTHYGDVYGARVSRDDAYSYYRELLDLARTGTIGVAALAELDRARSIAEMFPGTDLASLEYGYGRDGSVEVTGLTPESNLADVQAQIDALPSGSQNRGGGRDWRPWAAVAALTVLLFGRR